MSLYNQATCTTDVYDGRVRDAKHIVTICFGPTPSGHHPADKQVTVTRTLPTAATQRSLSIEQTANRPTSEPHATLPIRKTCSEGP